jgi:hypothetical protein
MGGGGDNKIEETEQQKALAEVSMKEWRNYLDKYRLFENAYMDDVDRMNTSQQYDQVAGLAAVPVESEFTNAVMQTSDAMVGAGLNPNSGIFKAELDKLDRRKAQVKADSMSQAQLGQQNRYLGGIQNIVRMGQGQATEAVQGFGDMASMSGQKAYNDARNTLENRSNNAQIGGQVIGAGVRYGLRQYDGKS